MPSGLAHHKFQADQERFNNLEYVVKPHTLVEVIDDYSTLRVISSFRQTVSTYGVVDQYSPIGSRLVVTVINYG